ncbi:helix-turn-helix transcriptional regulator [Cryptosporangium japonicum]|uniref:LuxR family transcriptional regulator n=1 Tax=Cryptosporangium japonicum TaxID=80872 RepID=A0ABN0TZP7_9ACTN
MRERLHGRDEELGRLDELVAAARDGHGGALLVVGEPGIGKTALLSAVTGPRVIRLEGYEAESAIPYAGVHRLVLPLREHLPGLPGRQQEALRVAAGLADGPAPDRYLVGLGVLGLLIAAREPLLGLVDDAHLLDAESLEALGFVARRLEAEPVAFVFAARGELALAGVPLLRLGGLDAGSAATLLRSVSADPIDPATAARIVAATGGNPLALIDLAGELSVKQLTVADEPIPVGSRLEQLYLRQVRGTASQRQEWLLIAAADSTGNVDLVRAAAAALGLPDTAGDEPDLTGLVELGSTLRFRHALVRSAVYNGVSGAERRRAHRALSASAAELGLVEQAAWHAAKATVGTDPDVADRLEQVADLAGRRGGFRSRADVLTEAARLSPPGPVRDRRLLTAAEAALAAGAAGLARSLVEDLRDDAVDHVTRGRLISVRVGHAFFTGEPAIVRGAAEMLTAAACFSGHDVAAEQDALIMAFNRLLPVERSTTDVPLTTLGRRMLDGAALADGVAGTILRAFGTLLLRPYREAVPDLRAAAAVIDSLTGPDLIRYGLVGVPLHTALWDADAIRRTVDRVVETARELGSLQVIDTVLWTMSLSLLSIGTPRESEEHMARVRRLRRALGWDAEHVVNGALLAWSGGPREHVEAIADGALAVGWGGVHAAGVSALGVRDLAERRYQDAYARLKPFVDDPFLHVTPLNYGDFAEAAARSGHPDEAAAITARLEEIAAANRAPWATLIARRSRALITDDEACYTEAVSVAGPPVERARAHLVYGEWLRRVRRRREAREQARRALEMFEDAAAPAFAERARAELAALTPSSDGAPLTAQELSVARLAAGGATNAEIGAALFISPNTVDYHLRKIYQRLGITSRRQLGGRLG